MVMVMVTHAFVKVTSFPYHSTTILIIRMGKCILLENDMFHTGLGLSKRKGSSVDRSLIIDAFHRLGFQVFRADNDDDDDSDDSNDDDDDSDACTVTEADADGVCLCQYQSSTEEDTDTYADADHQQMKLMPMQMYTRWRSIRLSADETKC